MPIFAIVDGLHAGQKLRREDLHAQELGISTLIAYTINMNRSTKSKSPPARPKNFFNFAPLDSKLRITPKAAKCFFALADDRLLPPWALDVMKGEISELEKLNKTPVDLLEFRAFEGEECLILAPDIADNFIYAPLVIWQCPPKEVQIWNVDDRPPGASRRYRPTQRIKITPDVKPDFEGYCTDSVLTIIQDN